MPTRAECIERAAIALATGRVTGAKIDVLPHDPGQRCATPLRQSNNEPSFLLDTPCGAG